MGPKCPNTDLSLCWTHRPFCWFSYAVAHFAYLIEFRFYILVNIISVMLRCYLYIWGRPIVLLYVPNLFYSSPDSQP